MSAVKKRPSWAESSSEDSWGKACCHYFGWSALSFWLHCWMRQCVTRTEKEHIVTEYKWNTKHNPATQGLEVNWVFKELIPHRWGLLVFAYIWDFCYTILLCMYTRGQLGSLQNYQLKDRESLWFYRHQSNCLHRNRRTELRFTLTFFRTFIAKIFPEVAPDTFRTWNT